MNGNENNDAGDVFKSLRLEEVSELARRFTNLSDAEKRSFLDRISPEINKLRKPGPNRSKLQM